MPSRPTNIYMDLAASVIPVVATECNDFSTLTHQFQHDNNPLSPHMYGLPCKSFDDAFFISFINENLEFRLES